MKVAFDATSILGHSGIEVYGRNLVHSLLQHTDVQPLLAGLRGRREYLRAEFGAGVNVHATIIHELAGGPMLRPLARVIQTKQLDSIAIEANVLHLIGNALWRKPTVPYVVTIHDLFPMLPETMDEPYKARTFQRQVSLHVKNARAIIVPTEWTAHTLYDAFPDSRSKTYVVHNSSRISFAPLELHSDVRATLDIPEGRSFLFFVGRVDKRKNLTRMLQAWASLPKSLTSTHRYVLALSGDPRHIAEFKATHSSLLKLPGVRVAYGLSDEMVMRLYGSAAGLTFVSTAEGFGLPALEAMQCGCPVLTSTTTCMPEVVGSAALLADPHNIENIALQMEKLLTDSALQHELIQRGYERVRHFTPGKMGEQTTQVYREVVGT